MKTIKEVKDHVPMIIDGSGLQRIFDMQKVLIDEYIKIEKMPRYPIGLDSKDDQMLVKDFIGRAIEEMAEAFTAYAEMVDKVNLNDKEGLLGLLENFNEELSDTTHFFIEILVYLNIDHDDIIEFYKQLLKKTELTELAWFGGKDILKTIFAFALHTNVQAGYKGGIYNMGYKVIQDKDLKDEFLRGGRTVDQDNLEIMERFMWRVVHRLNKARNFLRNKPWKQTENETDIQRFHLEIMEAWLIYIQLLDFVGITPESLFTIYFKKNKINLYRIENKY